MGGLHDLGPQAADFVGNATALAVHRDLEGQAGDRVLHFDHIVGGVATGRHGWRAGDQVDRAAREREVRACSCRRW